MLTAFPFARPGEAGREPANGRTATTFIQSGRNSWAETDLKLLTTRRPGAARTRQGRRAGTGLARRCGVGAGGRTAAAARRPVKPPNPEQARDPHRRHRRLRLRHQRRPRDRRQPRPLPQHRQLAGAAGEPDLGPAARSAGPAHHADRRSGSLHLLADGADHPRRDPAGRRPDLVAEALDARPAFVSVDLLVILIALGGYLYFVESKKPAGSDAEKKEKAFTVEADKIEEFTIKSESGERTTLRKSGTDWQIAQPARRQAGLRRSIRHHLEPLVARDPARHRREPVGPHGVRPHPAARGGDASRPAARITSC